MKFLVVDPTFDTIHIAAIKCPLFSVKGATITTSGTNYLSVITVTCNRGHYFDDMTVTRTVLCLENEQWSATVEPCTGKHHYIYSRKGRHFCSAHCIGACKEMHTCNERNTGSSDVNTSCPAFCSNTLP